MKKRIFAAALSLALAVSAAAPVGALELEDARDLLRQYYIEPIPESVLALDSLDDILAALNDPYTSYLTPEAYEALTASVDGEKLVGIGVSAQTVFDDGYIILAVLPNSPALEAGLKAGDRIIAVDGVTLTDQIPLNSMVGGEEGTNVTVTVRSANGTVRDVTMVRRTVQLPIVTYERVGEVGMIDCTSFGESTGETVRQALSELGKRTSVWMVDLRSNPGGTTQAAVEMSGAFLGSATISYFRDSNGNYSYYYTTDASQDLTDRPLIILTSPHSASGSELFSAAIRDNQAGIAVGQRTFGKGIAQYVFDETSHPSYFDGDAFRITSMRFFSPLGATNHLIGVLPTLMVSEEQTETVAQLLTAPKPLNVWGHLKLEVAGQTFYIKLAQAKQVPAAFAELLEAIPPHASLFREGSSSIAWVSTTPEEIADIYKLDYQPRTFSDLDGAQYAREIRTLATYELLSGYEGQFFPGQVITRAELCSILANALNLPVNAKAPAFSDVSPDAWYAQAVSAMSAFGFMVGSDNGTFSPEAPVTNQELVTILSALASWLSMDGYELDQEELTIQQWLDFYYYPEWSRTAARNMVSMGLPVDMENPGAEVTRDTAAGMICQLLEITNIIWNGKDMHDNDQD